VSAADCKGCPFAQSVPAALELEERETTQNVTGEAAFASNSYRNGEM